MRSPTHRDDLTALLSYAMETHLIGAPVDRELLGNADPWDLWWLRTRSASLTAQIAVPDLSGDGTCTRCRADVLHLIELDPPGIPEPSEQRPCGCLLA